MGHEVTKTKNYKMAADKNEKDKIIKGDTFGGIGSGDLVK
jgi:hypothetical protein